MFPTIDTLISLPNFVQHSIFMFNFTCATIIQNSTNYFATLPPGLIGYIEVPITSGKP